jgi:hypothetical protein
VGVTLHNHGEYYRGHTDIRTCTPSGSFVLAFSVRAGINVLLVILLRRRKMRLAMLRHAIFGAEPFRFGAMIGE